MLLVAEIGMLVLGIITVATGKLSTSAGKECRGVPARIAGVLLILPLPISLLIGLMIAVILTSQGRHFDERAAWPTLVELGVFLVFVITAFVIAGMNAQPIGRATARRRGAATTTTRGIIPRSARRAGIGTTAARAIPTAGKGRGARRTTGFVDCAAPARRRPLVRAPMTDPRSVPRA